MIGRHLRTLSSSAVHKFRGHGNAMNWFAPNITPEAKYQRKQWLHSLEKKQHNDMGEWSKKNNMIYPPLEEGEPPRPHEIYWGRGRVAICRRVMARTCLTVNNLELQDALDKMYNLKAREGFIMYEVLREARDFATKRAPSANTFHIAECWATVLNREYRHGYAILRKRDLTNIYVLLREGPPPAEREKLTTEDAIDHYLQGHREKEIPLTW